MRSVQPLDFCKAIVIAFGAIHGIANKQAGILPTDRYYFHITDGEQTLVDPEGIELASVLAARERATRHGRLVVQNVGALVDVTNSAGTSVLRAPLVISDDDASHLEDSLTGLAGRTAFLKHLTQAIQAHEQGSVIGLLLIDLDRLKETNDAFGYPAGDAVLQHVTVILNNQANGRSYAVARLEGDKFAIILRAETLPDAVAFAESVHGTLRKPLQYGEVLVTHPASGGLALFPIHAQTATELIGSADIALRVAKAGGGGSVIVYEHGMRSDQEQHFEALAEARSALAESRIVPHYQPKVLLKTGLICGFEALLRLRDPRLGIRPPVTIADALDHPELSVVIGREMQERVFDDIQSWIKASVDFGTVAINASPVELLLSPYADAFLERLAKRNICPRLLQVEVTETAMTGRGSIKIVGELEKLRANGVAVFLDDFGTGYGSLVHLREFPINGIKIDQSFVKDAGEDFDARAIAKVLIELAKNLNLLLVAEGVETPEQAEFLLSEGCEVVQGYLYAKAMPAETVEAFLLDWAKTRVVEHAG